MDGKKLKYSPLSDMNTYNCREFAFVSILQTYINQYDMLNKDSLHIILHKKNLEEFDAKAERLIIDTNMYDLAEQYYGFRFLDFHKNDASLIDIIDTEIENDRICLISMDLFWNNYKPDYYKKVHTPLHDQVLTGKTADKYICYTWYSEYSLAREDVFHGCQYLTTFERTESTQQVCKQLLFDGLVEICSVEKETEMILDQIIYAFQNTDVEELYSATTELTQANLFMNLRIMARSRERFAGYMKYLLEIYKQELQYNVINDYMKVCDLLKEIADIWWKISNILLKFEYIYRQGKKIQNNEVRKNILHNLSVVAQLEKDMTAQCQSMLR